MDLSVCLLSKPSVNLFKIEKDVFFRLRIFVMTRFKLVFADALSIHRCVERIFSMEKLVDSGVLLFLFFFFVYKKLSQLLRGSLFRACNDVTCLNF